MMVVSLYQMRQLSALLPIIIPIGRRISGREVGGSEAVNRRVCERLSVLSAATSDSGQRRIQLCAALSGGQSAAHVRVMKMTDRDGQGIRGIMRLGHRPK